MGRWYHGTEIPGSDGEDGPGRREGGSEEGDDVNSRPSRYLRQQEPHCGGRFLHLFAFVLQPLPFVQHESGALVIV